MKKLITSLCLVCFAFTAAVAQEQTTNKNPQEKVLSKEEKAAAKAKREADLQESFQGAGLTADEQQKVRTIMEESAAINKSIKEDGALSEDDKMAKSKENNRAKDSKIKTLLGDAKYNLMKQIQKKQREAAPMK